MLEEKGTCTDKWYFENFKCLKKIKAKGDFKAGIRQSIWSKASAIQASTTPATGKGRQLWKLAGWKEILIPWNALKKEGEL